MAQYESDITKFIRNFLEEHPEEIASQRKGRAIWWDKRPKELAEERVMDNSRVAQSPYVYDADS